MKPFVRSGPRLEWIAFTWRHSTAGRAVRLACGALLIANLAVGGQGSEPPKPHMTKQKAIEIGLGAIKAQYPERIAAHSPFDAEFGNGVWSVYGTIPKGIRGGGAPVAEVSDLDGKVLRLYLAR